MNAQKHDALENAGSKPLKNFSNFAETLPYRFANTYRFGEIGVHYLADVVPSENGKFVNSHKLRSYTMPNPLLQSLKMRKTYGLIPTSAVLPLNYEKYIMIPNRGEDINSQLIGCSVKGFIRNVHALMSALLTRGVSWYSLYSNPTNYFKFVVMYDMLYSNGSLLKSFGLTIAGKNTTPDDDVDAFWNGLVQAGISADVRWLFKLTIRSKSWYVGDSSAEIGIGHISLREAISRMRDDFSFDIAINEDIVIAPLLQLNWSAIDLVSTDETPIDTAPFFAYQLFCAQFFSNDHVDSIYTAELWRQNLYSLVKTIISNEADTTFSWNGVDYRYDVCSAFIMQRIFAVSPSISSGEVSSSVVSLVCDYFRLIFGYNRSLRYGDYFTGSRTLPLAPGDVNVSVNGDSFSVVENIQKSWYARLYAQISRVGRRIGEQTKALFKDTAVVQDWHEPIWLGETVSDVFPDEVDNTGQDMYDKEKPMSSISVLHSEQEALAFDLRVPDRFGVVIGFTWFDIARFYAHSTKRNFFHVTRFDKFNPYLQFNGDQPIYRKELTPDSHDLQQTFGYTGRYMEYKNNYNIAAGGFVDNTLPGLIFKADEGKDYVDISNISSDYIRSYPSELDKFYLSLSGWSLGHYFHFLVINTNMYDGNKPMAYNPTLD